MMVDGKAEYYFKSAIEGLRYFRELDSEVQDQNLPPFVIVNEAEKPVGKIEEGDSLIYYNFRADRAIEIAQAFTYWDFPYFDRGNYRPDFVYFVGMTEYDSNTHVPEHRLYDPAVIEKPLNKFLSERKIMDLACSETVKYGHITYYFNGNNYEPAEGEKFIEIKSYAEPFEEKPWMKCAEITDAVVSEMKDFNFVRLNYPGGDMVGHSADVMATIVGVEAIDLSLKRLAKKVDELGGALIIVADHGNAEELLDAEGNPKTAHTTNQVPCIFYDNTKNRKKYFIKEGQFGLANLASTIALMLGQNDYPNEWQEPIIGIK